MAKTTQCRRCGRTLTDPKHVAAGIGPVCAGKAAAEPAEGGMLDKDRGGTQAGRLSRSEWTFRVEGDFVLVEDLNRGGRSVTNDAENVLADLGREIGLAGKRILYRDSEERWDEIRHEGVFFRGFAPNGARTPSEAIAVALGAPGWKAVDTNAFPGDPFLDGTIELQR